MLPLSLVLPTKRHISKLQAVLANLDEHLTIDREIIVVYAESYDEDTKQWIKNQPNIVPVSDSNEDSLIKIINIGFRNVTGKYTMQWCDDAFTTAGITEEGIEYLDSHPDVGGVAFNMHTVRIGRKGIDSSGFRYMSYRNNEKVVFLNSGIMRTEVIKDIGFYDERYVSYFGQPDLTIKIRESGYKIVSFPHCKVMHYLEDDELRKKNTQFYTSDREKFLDKWKGIAGAPQR